MIQPPTKPQQALYAHPLCVVPGGWNIKFSQQRIVDRGERCFRFILPRSGVNWTTLPNGTGMPRRVDGLWQHSCVELFIGVQGSQAYREYNFAIDGRWAAYDFSNYRERVIDLPSVPTPQISSEATEEGFCVLVKLTADTIPDDSETEMNAAVVLETESGSLSYWAANHPCAQPDFHHRGSFVLTLA